MLPGLAIDHGARGRELVAEPDIVEEAGHLFLVMRGPGAGRAISSGRVGSVGEIHLARHFPAAASVFSSTTTPLV